MKIGKRDLNTLIQRVIDPSSYQSIPEFFNVYQNPIQAMYEEFFSLGTYPRKVDLKTPTGNYSVKLFSLSDFSTLNLIFCRQDYYIPDNLGVVVDIGSNIGLSTFYWLTRNTKSVVYCYEPSPISFNRLVDNLKDFEGRYFPYQAAVSDFSGVANLGIEESGVYSSLDLESERSVECQVIHINNLLEDILSKHQKIDVLKIDSEGHEIRTIAAIDKSFWKHIQCINTDCKGASSYIPEDFKYSTLASAERFYR
jgi:FkbM family methyltransferase